MEDQIMKLTRTMRQGLMIKVDPFFQVRRRSLMKLQIQMMIRKEEKEMIDLAQTLITNKHH